MKPPRQPYQPAKGIVDLWEDVPGWCSKHIPHNIIAGGGLDAYGGSDHSTMANHGTFPQEDQRCKDCLAIKQKEFDRSPSYYREGGFRNRNPW